MTKSNSIFHFSPQEAKDIIISWLTLSLAFAVVINPVFFNISNLVLSLPIALLAVGTGFVLHELAHREMAKHYGFHSEFRAWYPGLLIAIGLAVITMGQFIFAAPGATYFYGQNVTKRQNGIISLAGPAINLILGIVLLILGGFMADAFIGKMFGYAALINFWFALFNLIPIYPLDGSKVIAWKPFVWIVFIAISALLAFMPELVTSLL
ncbi:Peptidase family M50 [uncultured archaeon]|nr:Peptidase family M50 [uncultured archaeon]